MKKIGIIDIGSNSIRLLLVKIGFNSTFQVFNEVKEIARLGKDMKDNKLNEERIKKAIDTLLFFKNICNSMDIYEIISIATEAVRKADNQIEFIKRVKDELNLEIRVLSGLEEAYYDYFGIINSIDIKECLIMDIGGRSTELIWVNNRDIKESISIPIGAINLTEKLDLDKNNNMDKELALKNYILGYLKGIPWLSHIKNLPMVGVGGTIRNIGKINRKKTNYPLEHSHNYHMNSSEVLEIYEEFKTSTPSNRKKFKGLSKDRADIFLGALSAVVSVIEYCNIKNVYISGNGLREGLFYEYLLKSNKPVEDVLDFHLNNLIEYYQLPKAHCYHICKLILSLYNQLQPLHKIQGDTYKILRTCSLLHDCGIYIDYYNHNKHSFNIILNSTIKGLSHREQLIAAYVTGFHRKNEFIINSFKHKKILSKEDILLIKQLGIMLRIAETLDMGLSGNIEDIKCSISKEKVNIKLICEKDCSIEIEKAMEVASSFYKVFNKKLVIE